jgi:hypothetical protein
MTRLDWESTAAEVIEGIDLRLEGVSGRYYEDCAEAAVVHERAAVGVAPYALDPDNAERLWELSVAATQPVHAG